MNIPLTVVTVEICGDPDVALGAWPVLAPMVSAALASLRASGRAVEHLRIGSVTVGRVIVASIPADPPAGPRRTDPDSYAEGLS